MSAHTPAPWYWADNVPDAPPHYRMVVDADGFTVCDPSPMGEADARLIAAAPDLLAALRNVIASYRANDPDSMANAINDAEAAIAKATGSAP
jgi:hypothetical protein